MGGRIFIETPDEHAAWMGRHTTGKLAAATRPKAE